MNDKPVAPEDVAVKTSTALVKVSEAYDQPTKPGPFSPALYASLQAAADFFNARFFDGALSDVVLTLQPHANSKGHFTWDAYAGRHGRDVPPCGINLNPDSFTGASDADIASTLLHELCHLWRHENGPLQKRHYHDRLWTAKMKSVGLIPSSIGMPGGREVGSKMSHYVLRDGPFAQSFAELQATGWRLDLESAPRRGSAKGPPSKVKYSCSRCSLNVWAKPSVEVLCKRCSIEYGSMIDMLPEGATSDLAQAAE